LFAGPEEGPADRPEDEEDGQEEEDETAFAHTGFQPVNAGYARWRLLCL
jgi:hypothetical protein